jgi:hypothetical protein
MPNGSSAMSVVGSMVVSVMRGSVGMWWGATLPEVARAVEKYSYGGICVEFRGPICTADDFLGFRLQRSLNRNRFRSI